MPPTVESATEIASRISAAPADQRYALVQAWAHRLIEEQHRTDADSDHWAYELATVLADSDLSIHHRRELAGVLTWWARDATLPVPLADSGPTLPAEVGLDLVYIAAFWRRYEFRFRSLEQLALVARGQFDDDPLLDCFAVFAALGLARDSALAALEHTESRADLDWDCRFVLLQGMWLAPDLPHQDRRILALSEEIIARGEDTANVYFWRSGALRRAGRYDEALQSADQALNRHALRDNAVHQDYMRERELVLAMRSLDRNFEAKTDAIRATLQRELDGHLDEARAEFGRRAAAAEEVVSRSLTGLVEILGLFLAVVVFLAGSGYLTLSSGSFWKHLAGVAVLGVGSVLFFLTLRAVTRPRSR